MEEKSLQGFEDPDNQFDEIDELDLLWQQGEEILKKSNLGEYFIDENKFDKKLSISSLNFEPIDLEG